MRDALRTLPNEQRAQVISAVTDRAADRIRAARLFKGDNLEHMFRREAIAAIRAAKAFGVSTRRIRSAFRIQHG